MKIMPGNGIARQYKMSRQIRNRGWAMFGASTVLAGLSAHNKDVFLTVALGGSSLLWGKITESAVNKMLSLKEQYKPILERAKQIKANRR